MMFARCTLVLFGVTLASMWVNGGLHCASGTAPGGAISKTCTAQMTCLIRDCFTVTEHAILRRALSDELGEGNHAGGRGRIHAGPVLGRWHALWEPPRGLRSSDCLQAGDRQARGRDHAGAGRLRAGAVLRRWHTHWESCAERLAERCALGLQEDAQLGEEQVRVSMWHLEPMLASCYLLLWKALCKGHLSQSICICFPLNRTLGWAVQAHADMYL